LNLVRRERQIFVILYNGASYTLGAVFLRQAQACGATVTAHGHRP